MSIDNDIGNFALSGIIGRRLEDAKLDKGFHGKGKKQLQEAWELMKERVEAALKLDVLPEREP